MATLGLSFVIEGFARTLFGSHVHELDLGIDDTPLDIFGLQIGEFDIFASTIAIVLVAVLAVHFRFPAVRAAKSARLTSASRNPLAESGGRWTWRFGFLDTRSRGFVMPVGAARMASKRFRPRRAVRGP